MKNILFKGNFLNLINDEGWEYVDRPASLGVVSVVGIVDECVLLVQQFRRSQQRSVISLPGGLVERARTGERQETAIEAARRELREETGYEPGVFEELVNGPVSPGMTTELVTFFIARQLMKVGDQSLDDDEDIIVHLIRISDAPRWLRDCDEHEIKIDLKVFVGLYFLNVHRSS
jgi:ADP-ribose pyrophosphatase